MTRRGLRAACWLACAAAALHGSAAAAPDPTLEGSLRSGAVYRPHDERHRANPVGEVRLKARWSVAEADVVADGRLRGDGAYAGAGSYGDQARRAYAWTADWRELSLTAPLPGDWRGTVGYQQLNWGRADNLRVLDQVNPLDLRDHVLPEMEDYRIALPLLRLQGPPGGSGWFIDSYWAPRFEPHHLAVTGSEFDLRQTAPMLAAGIEVLPTQRPATGWREGEAGIHISRSLAGVDLSLVAMRLWDRSPVYRLQAAPAGGGIQARGEYQRQTLWGAGMAWAYPGGWVWRAEVARLPGVTYNTSRTADGLTRSSHTSALLGLDRAWRDWLFTAQVSDRHIGHWQPGDLLPQHQPILTLAATGSGFDARLENRVSCAWMMRNRDGTLCQVRLTYKPTDSLFLVAGADMFNGPDTGFFGRFDAQDRLWLQLGTRF